MTKSHTLSAQESSLIHQAQDATLDDHTRQKARRKLVRSYGWGWAKIRRLTTFSPTAFEENGRNGAYHHESALRDKPLRGDLE